MERPFDVVIVGYITIDVNTMPWGVIENMLGGPPTYAGFTLDKLGKRVGIVSKVGTDFPEKFPLVYSRIGLDTEGIMTIGPETTTFENIYDEAGNREQKCKPITAKITPDDIPQIYKDAACFYISPVADEITPELVETLKSNGGKVMLDPQGLFRKVGNDGKVRVQHRDDLADFLANVDIVKLGLEELKAFAGEPKDALEKLRGMGPDIAIATRGGDRCVMVSKDGYLEIDPLKVEAKDLTGAGDVFGAAFIAKYMENEDPLDSAHYAMAAAGLKIRYKGPTGFPTDEEIREAMKTQ